MSFLRWNKDHQPFYMRGISITMCARLFTSLVLCGDVAQNIWHLRKPYSAERARPAVQRWRANRGWAECALCKGRLGQYTILSEQTWWQIVVTTNCFCQWKVFCNTVLASKAAVFAVGRVWANSHDPIAGEELIEWWWTGTSLSIASAAPSFLAPSSPEGSSANRRGWCGEFECY